MNSKQRRKEKRRWQKENEEEIKKVIAWINSIEEFVPLSDIPDSNNVIETEMAAGQIERIKAFDCSFTMSKRYWRSFLIEKGISSEKFTASLSL